jgi:hypothetical protein
MLEGRAGLMYRRNYSQKMHDEVEKRFQDSKIMLLDNTIC